MTEVLEFIFSSFWTWSGTCMLIISFGWAAAVPFRAWYMLKQLKLNRSVMSKYYN